MATPCFAYYGDTTVSQFGEVMAFQGPLADIPKLVDPTQNRDGTPSNFWPEDRSWLVYTNWDLLATKVSGPVSLVERLELEPALETLRWTRREGSGTA